MPSVGKMKKLNLNEIRKVWPNEQKDFSRWVANNIDVLNENLSLQIEIVAAEDPVHSFRADLVGTDNALQVPVVIENQFGKSNHDHLGKLITYSADKEAGEMIWICNEMQTAHKLALEWLNKITPKEMTFYGVELEMFKIDTSSPAPYFRIVAGPPPEKRPPISLDISPRNKKYQEFFNRLRGKLLELQPNFTRAKALPQNWWNVGIGRSGFWSSCNFTSDNKFRVEIYIDTGKKENNNAAFTDLKDNKTFIEDKIGTELIWEPLPEKRACRIYKEMEGTIDDNSEQQEYMINWSAPLIIKFREVFAPLIKNIQIGERMLEDNQ